MADKEATIIIKKIKKGGHGHHGGAWKVAYADFVTAMMAFFLLLWLLQATAQSQKEGIAEYFTPTIGVRDAAGIGFKGGKTSYDEGRKVAERSPPGILVGRMPQGPTAQKQERQAPVESTQDAYLFEKAEKNLKQAMEEDPNFRDFKDNVIVEQSPEGLKIEVLDDEKLPMFEPKSYQLTQSGEKILKRMAAVIKAMPNRISITGHSEATNFVENDTNTNWEITANRANAARRFLMLSNIGEDRVAKVVGRADQELLDTKAPTSPRNRRVEIVLLRNAYLRTLDEHISAPQNLLTVPKVSTRENTPPPVQAKPVAPKPVEKKADVPKVRAESNNIDTFNTQFKMSDSLKRALSTLPQEEADPNEAAPAPKAQPPAESE